MSDPEPVGEILKRVMAVAAGSLTELSDRELEIFVQAVADLVIARLAQDPRLAPLFTKPDPTDEHFT
jgi:hypothetical protein